MKALNVEEIELLTNFFSVAIAKDTNSYTLVWVTDKYIELDFDKEKDSNTVELVASYRTGSLPLIKRVAYSRHVPCNLSVDDYIKYTDELVNAILKEI